MEELKYHNQLVYKLNQELLDSWQLEKIQTDSENWRTYYTNSDSNWISFYPYSEYHGGGQPYIIKIGLKDFQDWISDNVHFEKLIRNIIENE